MPRITRLRDFSAAHFRLSDLLQIILGTLLVGGVLIPNAQAQHAMHSMAADAGELTLTTRPADDAVLVSQPDQLMLDFGPEVRLVKLAVRTPDSDLLDIGFRYSPRSADQFSHPLPELQAADYYTVEWAVLDAEESLVKGDFHFSVGADSRPPSYYLNQMEQMQHIMAPDYRLLGPDAQ